MRLVSKFHPDSNSPAEVDLTPVDQVEEVVTQYRGNHSDKIEENPVEHPGLDDSEPEKAHIQRGVLIAEAGRTLWTRNQLIVAYITIWIIEFIGAFSQGMTSTLTPYVTSSFQEHSLTATTSILSGLIGGLITLPYAKVLDIWGRPQAYALMVLAETIGLIMMAGCNNVKTYCAAQIFYYIGTNGITFTHMIFIADTTSLKNRCFFIAFTSSPTVATTWAYGPATEAVLNHIGYRWGFGIWAIIVPLTCAPLFSMFYWNQIRAYREGIVHKVPSGRNFWQSLVYYGIEFDVVGLAILSAGLALFLLAFSLYSYQADQWRSPLIICFIIFGALLVVAFCWYERYIAPVTFVPWTLMKNRTVFFTFVMCASMYCAFSLWYSYFYSMLIVVFDTSVTVATYINNIYGVGSCFWAVIQGLAILYNGRIKWHVFLFGLPLSILGVGLMIYFRQPDQDVGYLAMCMIFIAFGYGTIVMCEQMTVMAVSSHKNIPAILAMEMMIGSIGGSIGSTIAAALWTGVFPEKLAKYLPADAPIAEIYGSIDVQSSYPVGSDIRNGINRAYGDAQRLMVITAVCLYVIGWIATLFWEDIDIRKMKLKKGIIF